MPSKSVWNPRGEVAALPWLSTPTSIEPGSGLRANQGKMSGSYCSRCSIDGGLPEHIPDRALREPGYEL
jgi:hypothetical protein